MGKLQEWVAAQRRAGGEQLYRWINPRTATSSFETVISDEILRNREIMGVWPLEAVKNSGQALGDR